MKSPRFFSRFICLANVALCALAAAATEPSAKAVPLADLLKASPAGDWRMLDPQHTLYLELPAGRVVIELAQAYAPATVDAVRELVRERYFDGSFVVRSQDNYVVQWARPEEDDRAKAMESIRRKAEFFRAIAPALPFTRLAYPDTYAPEVGFSAGFPVARDPKRRRTWLVHCYGAVGVGRGNAPDSGNGSELYAVIGHSPRNLDRNVTLVGRVVKGIELLSVIPRGPGPMGFYDKREQFVPIRAVRIASEVPAAEREPLEALRTDSATFRKVIESRANRREEWFQEAVGRVGVCNVPLPVRLREAP